MPRLQNISAINGTFDNLNVKNYSVDVPYSLTIASTESLPEEGESFSTTAFIPFNMKVMSITLQINQRVVCDTKVRVVMNGSMYIFNISQSQPTLNLPINNMALSKSTYITVCIDNMPDDDGDVSACSVLLHGTCKM